MVITSATARFDGTRPGTQEPTAAAASSTATTIAMGKLTVPRSTRREGDMIQRMFESTQQRLFAPPSFLLAGLAAVFACSGSSAKVTDKDGVGDAAGDHASVAPGGDGGTQTLLDGGGDGSTLPPTLITEPDQGMTPIYSLIGSAKKTIDVTMYEFEDTTASGLLTTAAKNGVTVRVIFDQNLEKSRNTTAFNALSAGGVQVHWADTTYAATHQKTITVDGTTSAVMTLNLTPYYYATSRDFAVITSDAADVAAIESTFDADFASASITPPTGDNLVWSPTNSQTALLDLINSAKATLLVENEEMGDVAIVSALGTTASHGVDVKVVMTASKSWDSNFTILANAGVKIATYASSASLYIHAKVILADYGTSAGRVFIGSENFSDASLTKNRELGLITSDPTVMASINSTLTKDFDGGTAYP